MTVPYGSIPPKKEKKVINFMKGFGAAFGMVLALGICACSFLGTKSCIDSDAAEEEFLKDYDKAMVVYNRDDQNETLQKMYAEGWEYYDSYGNFDDILLIRKKKANESE